ncbi:FAD-binding oxidoreductase [Reyranella sp. CPCC 100927]|uniref:NAD(P)/FAD-dependent oxidoreductase n=1 Tax=Reyranella sp. CPCC 100927 TaxID=2599616 RepID=UPI0011B80DA9|nr:FAD-dependent oxidoreductase [Reyranella sp. CPCC 100927]TWT13061.1 FAD-binding oxidoreductase [Reyranella sp. CPCC 100927]
MISTDLSAAFWHAAAPPAPHTGPLDGDRDVDVAIVGGGFSGLSTALHLAEAGVSCAVVEAGDIGSGASGRNNGQVIPTMSRADPSAMVAAFGRERGERFAGLVRDSAQTVFDLVRRHAIDCAAEQSGWVQPAHTPGRLTKVAARRFKEWGALGAPVELLDRQQTAALLGSDAYHGAWLNRSGGHINPLAFARGLARVALAHGAAIFTQSPARSIESLPDGGWRVRTPAGALRAGRVVIATNAYTDDVWPGLKRSVIPVFSFQMATRPLSDNVCKTLLPGRQAMSDTRGDLHFCRYTHDHRLVTGAPLLWRADMERRLPAHVGARLQGLFPQLGDVTFDHIWCGYVGMTADYFPHLHELAPGVATWIGCNGRGVALATALGPELARWAAGRAAISDLALPVTPLRPIPAHALAKRLARGMLWLYRRRDAREV